MVGRQPVDHLADAAFAAEEDMGLVAPERAQAWIGLAQRVDCLRHSHDAPPGRMTPAISSTPMILRPASPNPFSSLGSGPACTTASTCGSLARRGRSLR